MGCCENHSCGREIFAACVRCLSLLCYDHFQSDACKNHTTATVCYPAQSENYTVEGNAIETNTPPKKGHSKKEKIRKDVKIKRNLGLEYVSEKSGKIIPSKRQIKPRCKSISCKTRGLKCSDISDGIRYSIMNSYFDMGDIQRQREWLASHVIAQAVNRKKEDGQHSRKHRTLTYYLPFGDIKVKVCRIMFLNTVCVSEKQIRTVQKKTSISGILEKDHRGGRQISMKRRDEVLRASVEKHINTFPKMDSHYCRQNTSQQYLSPELSLTRMYNLYKEGNDNYEVSYSLYHSVFKSLKLKFHRPKKDLCGICESFQKNSADELLQIKYQKHTEEKKKVRYLKDQCKLRCKRDSKFSVACFDLQQSILLPISKRSEIFYKRKLSTYNFTVYELHSKTGHCFLWHEGLARRGANEISSNLLQFLKEKDNEGFEEIALFSDGCTGQNKNSITPAMLLFFVNYVSVNVKIITLHFFETNHGQNEGDSIHSTIERALRHAGDVFVPSQLVSIARLARKKPYSVQEVLPADILDWKEYSINLRLLRARMTEEGTDVDWTKIMEVQVQKGHVDRLFLKTSHLQSTFCTLKLPQNRQATFVPSAGPSKAYKQPVKISIEKYKDLLSLCSGGTPIITHPDHVLFYKNLPH